MIIEEREIQQNRSGEPRKSSWYFLQPNGRYSRSQFAFFYFVPIIISVILAYTVGVLVFYWFPIQVYLVIVAGIRRLHDLNYSGWYLLLAFVPVLNIVMILYLLFAPGKVEGNRWSAT